MSGNGIWYKGKVQLALYDSSGALGGYSDPINGVKLSIKPDGDKKTRIDMGIENFGQAAEVKYIPKPTTLDFEVDEYTRDLLAAALLGTVSAYSQDAATAQTATVTLVLNQWVKLGKLHVSNVVIDTKVEGVDYAVNGHLGLVKALKSDMAGSHTVTFDTGTVTGDKILGATVSVVEFAVLMEVENNSDGLRGILDVPKVSTLPSAVFDFMGAKDFQSLKFGGDLVLMAGQPAFTFQPNLVFAAA